MADNWIRNMCSILYVILIFSNHLIIEINVMLTNDLEQPFYTKYYQGLGIFFWFIAISLHTQGLSKNVVYVP